MHTPFLLVFLTEFPRWCCLHHHKQLLNFPAVFAMLNLQNIFPIKSRCSGIEELPFPLNKYKGAKQVKDAPLLPERAIRSGPNSTVDKVRQQKTKPCWWITDSQPYMIQIRVPHLGSSHAYPPLNWEHTIVTLKRTHQSSIFWAICVEHISSRQ